MSAFESFPTCPRHLALLQDNRLTILERNALLVLAAHVSLTATVSYEQLRTYPPHSASQCSMSGTAAVNGGEAWNPVAYLFGLIKKALAGQFRLWAGRRAVPEATTPEVVPVVSKVRQAVPAVPPTSPKPDYQPATPEVARGHLRNIRSLIKQLNHKQGKPAFT